MNLIRHHSRAAALVSATALVLLTSPAISGSQRDRNRPVEISYTKWFTSSNAMKGFVGDDESVLAFTGHLFLASGSANGHVIRLEAMYEVESGDRSFTAMIRGGQSGASGLGLLDGIILDGWRTGASLHAEFHAKSAPSPNETACPGAPLGITCFEGTLTIGPVPN